MTRWMVALKRPLVQRFINSPTIDNEAAGYRRRGKPFAILVP